MTAENKDALSGDRQKVRSEVRNLNEPAFLCEGWVGFTGPAHDPGTVHIEDRNEFRMLRLVPIFGDVDTQGQESCSSCGRLDHSICEDRVEGHFGGSD